VILYVVLLDFDCCEMFIAEVDVGIAIDSGVADTVGI